MFVGIVIAGIFLWLVWDDFRGNPEPRKEPNWGHLFNDSGVDTE